LFYFNAGVFISKIVVVEVVVGVMAESAVKANGADFKKGPC